MMGNDQGKRFCGVAGRTKGQVVKVLHMCKYRRREHTSGVPMKNPSDSLPIEKGLFGGGGIDREITPD
jgi:hypothetical protein